MAETPLMHLHGIFHDVLRDAHGQVLWDRGWRKNVIVVDCRRLLAGFMTGEGNTLGIQGLLVGAGSEAWDPAGPPPPGPGDLTLTDPKPLLIKRSDLVVEYLEPNSDVPSVLPTNKIQIRAKLGPNIPAWPDADHPTSTLREFGLVARLKGKSVLINHVRHLAIAKDPTSTLDRTIWLVF